MMRLYRNAISGHCHRVELLLSILGINYEPVEVDLRAGAQKSAEFLALNPFGQIEPDDRRHCDVCLHRSCA